MSSGNTEESTLPGTPTSLNSRLRKSNVSTETESENDLEKKGRTRKHKTHEKIYLRPGVQRISSNLVVNKKCISTRKSSSSSNARPRHEYTTKPSISKMKHTGTIGTPSDGDNNHEGCSIPEESVSSSYEQETHLSDTHQSSVETTEEPPEAYSSSSSSYEKEPSLSDTRKSSEEPVEESSETQKYEPMITILYAMSEVDEPEWSEDDESHKLIHRIPGLSEGIEIIGAGDVVLDINGGKPKATLLTTTSEVAPRSSEGSENVKDDSTLSANVLIIRESNKRTSHVLSPNCSSARPHSQEKLEDKHSQQEVECVEDLLRSKVVPQNENQMKDVIKTDKLDEEIVYQHASVIEDNEFHVQTKANCCATLVVGCCVEQIENTSRNTNFDHETSDTSEEGHDIISNTFESNYDKHCDNRNKLVCGNHGAYHVSQSIIKRLKRVIPNVSGMSDECETSISECDCLGTTETDNLIKIHQYGPYDNPCQLLSDTKHSIESTSEFESSHCNIQSSNDHSDKSSQYSPWIDVPVLPTSAASEDMTPHSDTGNSSTPDIRFHVTMSSRNHSAYICQEHCENTSCCFPSDLPSLELDYERSKTIDEGGVSPTDINYDVLSDLMADGFEFNQLVDDLVGSSSDCCIEVVNQDDLDDQEPIGGFAPIQECIGQDSMLSSTRLEVDACVAGRLPIATSKRVSDVANEYCQYGVKSDISFSHSLDISGGGKSPEEHVSLSHISPIGFCSGGQRTGGNQGRVQSIFDAYEPGACPRKDTPSSCLTRTMTRGWSIGSLFPVDDVFPYHNESDEGLDNSSMSNPSRGSTNEYKFDELENSFSFDVLGQSPRESLPLRSRIRSRFESSLSAPRLTSLFHGRDPTLPRPQRSPTSFLVQNPSHSCPLASSTPRKCQEFLRRRSSSQAKEMEDLSVQDTVNLFLTMTSPLKSGRALFM